ncbi:uncharacterized protein LOC114532114 [Dendronephthya gigantea]|uniref:uncharacterized protein LOC114532113 n=1 Tax=Dendronephthya gigantea TaxID=151771 RepID=UPI00106A2692|nr:uncharacterized protein LOC114532113 [Dendronephthya gigantea]XP_028409495.1 uncharacterized protein LOC114532114 [Dendronephthya gigantea]
MILFPINLNGNHWTLLVFDKVGKRKIYVDPLKTGKPSGLMGHIKKLSELVDVKTGWKTKRWPCLHPQHCMQHDSHNCGVYVCFFARCLVEGLDLTEQIDPEKERKNILSSICGSCYDDVGSAVERNTGVCKICRKDDGEDWLGCDRCYQFSMPVAEVWTSQLHLQENFIADVARCICK